MHQPRALCPLSTPPTSLPPLWPRLPAGQQRQLVQLVAELLQRRWRAVHTRLEVPDDELADAPVARN